MEDLKKIIKLQLKNLVEEVDGRDDGTYMIISNLEQMKRDIDKILSYKDSPYFHKVVTGDHAWAGDHITTSKDDVEEVSNFVEGFMEQMNLSEAKKKSNKLCSRGISAAKSKFKVYPSAYANGYAVQVCKGKIKGLDGKKRCSGSYCSGKKSTNENINESKKEDYKIYHDSYTSAINSALNYAEKKGYEYDKEESAEKIGLGPKKPSEGKTNKFSINLTKDGKPQRKNLQIQVYGMGNKYELNCYIN
jgi:hypothetical protein